MSHLDAGILHALLDGEIASPELPPIQEHLAGCAECRARLEEERQLLAESDGLVAVIEVPAGEPVKVRPATPPSRLRAVRSLAWAATFIAAVGLGYVARGVNQPSPKQEVAATLPAAAIDSPTPAAPRVTESTGFRGVPEESASREEAAGLGRESGRRTRSNLASELVQEKKSVSRQGDTVLAAAAPPPPAALAAIPAESLALAKAAVSAPPPTPAPTSGAANVFGAQRALGRLRDQPARVDQLPAAEVVLVLPEPITFPDAVRRLNGSLRLIDGLVPLRLEAQGLTVRVVYATAQGELILSQQLIDGRVTFQLIAPQNFAPDSLAKLRAKVR